MADANQYIHLFETEQLSEGALNVVLDVLGFIPGVGEAADFANTVLYLKAAQGGKDPARNYLFAALSAVSMFPGIGDVIGKGGKLLVAAGKAGKAGKGGVKAAKLLTKVQAKVAANLPKINKMFDALAGKQNAFKSFAPKMKAAMHAFAQRNMGKEDETAAQSTARGASLA